MTTAAEFQGPTPPAAAVQAHRVTDRTAAGEFLCSVWRTRFYSTILAAPVLIVMALSGLVIMYTEPITGLLYSKTTPGCRITVSFVDWSGWRIGVR